MPAQRFASYDFYLYILGSRLGNRQSRGSHILISRRHHFVLSRKVHPELESLQAAAIFSKLRARHLGMYETRARRHPLDIAGPDDPVVSL